MASQADGLLGGGWDIRACFIRLCRFLPFDPPWAETMKHESNRIFYGAINKWNWKLPTTRSFGEH